MSSHNTSIYKHKISIPILAEISSLTPNRLRKIYRQIITDDCIPLSEIPLHQQETFVNDYLLRGKTLDFDLMKLADKPDFENPFPFLHSTGVQKLFTTTKMIREVKCSHRRIHFLKKCNPKTATTRSPIRHLLPYSYKKEELFYEP